MPLCCVPVLAWRVLYARRLNSSKAAGPRTARGWSRHRVPCRGAAAVALPAQEPKAGEFGSDGPGSTARPGGKAARRVSARFGSGRGSWKVRRRGAPPGGRFPLNEPNAKSGAIPLENLDLEERPLPARPLFFPTEPKRLILQIPGDLGLVKGLFLAQKTNLNEPTFGP